MLPFWDIFVPRGTFQKKESLLASVEPEETEGGGCVCVTKSLPPSCRTERQYRDLAYCMSQLPLTERGLHKMLDNFECFGDKLVDESVFSAFLSVVGKLRRGAKPEGKVSGPVGFQCSKLSLPSLSALRLLFALLASLQLRN